jgi:hypothetical protein
MNSGTNGRSPLVQLGDQVEIRVVRGGNTIVMRVKAQLTPPLAFQLGEAFLTAIGATFTMHEGVPYPDGPHTHTNGVCGPACAAPHPFLPAPPPPPPPPTPRREVPVAFGAPAFMSADEVEKRIARQDDRLERGIVAAERQAAALETIASVASRRPAGLRAKRRRSARA